jgi:hypothetical protein
MARDRADKSGLCAVELGDELADTTHGGICIQNSQVVWVHAITWNERKDLPALIVNTQWSGHRIGMLCEVTQQVVRHRGPGTSTAPHRLTNPNHPGVQIPALQRKLMLVHCADYRPSSIRRLKR